MLARRGRITVWGITSGERGKTQTLMVCGSASCHSVPPLMIYPRVRMPESLKQGAPAGTMFETSPKGWMNQNIFVKWLDHFIAYVPRERPLLLIYDGHGSHLSIEVIEKAKKNDIHFLCLPSHCTHLLQPLHVSVMFSLKTHFGKACKQFLGQNVGRAIIEADLAYLVGQAWPLALTPSNLISGFCKSGIFPLNPGRIIDRHTAPSRALFESPVNPDHEESHRSDQSQESPQSQLSVSSQQSAQAQLSNSSQSQQSSPSISSLPSSAKSIDEILYFA